LLANMRLGKKLTDSDKTH